METITITAHTANNTQILAIKAFMKALKIKFEVSKEIAKEIAKEATENVAKKATEETESPYDPEFVKKILQADKDIAEGKGTKMSVDEFLALCR